MVLSEPYYACSGAITHWPGGVNPTFEIYTIQMADLRREGWYWK